MIELENPLPSEACLCRFFCSYVERGEQRAVLVGIFCSQCTLSNLLNVTFCFFLHTVDLMVMAYTDTHGQEQADTDKALNLFVKFE